MSLDMLPDRLIAELIAERITWCDLCRQHHVGPCPWPAIERRMTSTDSAVPTETQTQREQGEA